jgi:hypothetical protein
MWVAELSADWLDSALACAGICFSALPTNWETTHVAHTANTADSGKAFEISSALTAKITFDHILLFAHNRR